MHASAVVLVSEGESEAELVERLAPYETRWSPQMHKRVGWWDWITEVQLRMDWADAMTYNPRTLVTPDGVFHSHEWRGAHLVEDSDWRQTYWRELRKHPNMVPALVDYHL